MHIAASTVGTLARRRSVSPRCDRRRCRRRTLSAADPGIGRVADVGRHARPQHGVEHEGAAGRVGRQDQEEREVGRRPRLAELRQPGGRRRHGVRRHQQRAAARSKAARRSRRADGVPRIRRRVPVAADARRSSSRAAPTTGRFRASPRRRSSRTAGSTTPATAASCSASTSTASATTRTTARSRTRSSPGQYDADVIWSFDMMEEVGSYPHNLSNSSPVICGDLILRLDLERPGRKPRQHPVAAGAGDHRDQQEHRQAGLGRQLGRGPHPARPVVHAGGRHDRRRAAGGLGAGRRLGPRLRGGDRQEAVGVRHQPEGRGVAAHAQRADRDAGDLRGPRLHRQRPGSRARRRRRPLLRHRRHQARRHHHSRAGSGTSTRFAARSRPPAIADGLVYVADFSGFLHCLDAKTGQEYWTHDVLAAVWGSPFVVDGKVYLGDEDGDVVVLQHGKEMKVLHEMNMGSAVYATVVPAQRHAVHQQPQSAVRARGEMTRRRQAARVPAGPRLTRAGAVSLGAGRSPPSSRRRAPARRRPTSGGRFRGSPRQTGVSASAPPADAQAALDLRRRRDRRVVGGDRRRRGLCRRRRRRSARARSGHRRAALEVRDRQPDRRVVAGGRRAASSTSAISAASCTRSTRADGKRLWTFKTGSEIKSSPVVVNDVVLIGSYDGHLYALDARTGRHALEDPDRKARCTRRRPCTTG